MNKIDLFSFNYEYFSWFGALTIKGHKNSSHGLSDSIDNIGYIFVLIKHFIADKNLILLLFQENKFDRSDAGMGIGGLRGK